MKYIALVLALIGVGALAYGLMADDIEISIPESTVQEKVAEALPVNATKSGVDIHLPEAAVDFQAGDSAQITFSMTAEGLGMQAAITGDANSSIRYEDGSFFLDNLVINDLSVNPSSETSGKLAGAKATASQLFSKFVDGASDEDKQSITFLKDKAVSSLRTAASEFAMKSVQSIPVYTLDKSDLKMRLASAALKSITFTEDSVKATIDPGTLILKTLGFLLIVAASALVAVAIIRNPPVA